MKIVYKCLLFIVLFIPVLYIFSWIHELGHALFGVLTGNTITRIDVSITGGAVHIIYQNYGMKWLISIMGGMTTLIVSVPILIYSIRKINMYTFFIGFIHTTKEMFYWGISPFIKYGDAYQLIQWAEVGGLKIVPVIVYISSVITLILTIALFIMFEYYNIKVINRIYGRRKTYI